MPAPIRPVQPGDLISAAKFNEVVDALNALGRISGAFPICVSHDPAGVRIELAQQFKAWLFQIEETAGEIPRTSDGVAYYNATRLRLNQDDEYTPQDPQQVWVYDPLTKTSPGRVLRTGNWVLATFNADTGRWEIVRDLQDTSSIVRFRTTATLTIGGTAAAVIVRRVDGTDEDGDEITVADWSLPGKWYGPTGSQGIACKLADRDVYDILWLEHPSLFAVGYATGPMTGGVLPVNVTSTFDGSGPLSIASFYDVAGNYAAAAPGETFIARLDPATSTYKIIDGPPGGASLIRFELYERLEEGADADAHVVVWDGADWVVDSEQLIHAWDPENIGPGDSDHRGWCTYRADSEKYEVVSLDQLMAAIGWFVATEDHTLDSQDMSIHHFVRGMVCDDSLGNNPHGETLQFFLHSPSSATCPNVQYGAILPYHTDSSGRRVADGAYLDDYRGASKQHIGPENTIPFGWHLCDGSAGTPDLRSRFLLMANGDAPNNTNFDDHGHGDQIAAQGGTSEHNHLDALNQDTEPVAGQLHHYSHLSDDIETDDTELAIKSSPGATVNTSDTNLNVEGSVSAADGYTDYYKVVVTGDGGSFSTGGFTGYALAHPGILDPTTQRSFHPQHDHSFAAEATGCPSGDYSQPFGPEGGGPYSRDMYTGVALASTSYADPNAPEPLTDCGNRNHTIAFDHSIYEPGQAGPGGITYNPYVPSTTENDDIAGGAQGHRHEISGSISIGYFTATESGDGHRHSFSDLELSLDAHVTPDPHHHTVPIASIANGLWIVDETNYGDGDAGHFNLHHHHLVVDDHQLLPANHIPPYYALAQIMRVS